MPGVKEAAKLRRAEKLALREQESEEARRDEGEGFSGTVKERWF